MESLAPTVRIFSNFAVVKVVDAQALHLAHGVVDDDQALVPAGGISGAGGVGQVMADLVNLAPAGKPGRSRRTWASSASREKTLLVELGGDFVAGIELAVGSVVEAVRNLVDFVDGDAGLVEAEVDGVDGKVAGVLFCR